MMDEFNAWLKKVQEDIDHVKGILSEKISDEPEELIGDLQDAEAWNARCGFLLAEANSYLDRARNFMMPSKDGRTELDRKALLDSKIQPFRLVRDSVESLCNCIKQRLILGESILSYHKQFIERKVKPGGQPWG